MSEQKRTAQVSNLPDFSPILGCDLEPPDSYIHIGMLFTRKTACGQSMGATIMSKDITVTCPVCVDEIEYRSEHPEVARKEMGVVTHRGET